MKKVVLLIVALFLAACGGGGGSSTSDVTANTPTGAVSVSFTKPSAARTVNGVTDILSYQRVRVVITNPNLKWNGAPFKVWQDLPSNSATGFEFSLPLGTGYVIEALTYNQTSPTDNVPVEYAMAKSVSVLSATANPGIVLTLQPVDAKIVVPGTVMQGNSVNVMANFSSLGGRSVSALRSAWYMPAPATDDPTFAAFVNRTSAYTYSASHTARAENTLTSGHKMYYQGFFTVSPTLLINNETYKMWRFRAPVATFGNVSTAILANTNVTIPLP